MDYIKYPGYWVYSVIPKISLIFLGCQILRYINSDTQPWISLFSLIIAFPNIIEMNLSVCDYELIAYFSCFLMWRWYGYWLYILRISTSISILKLFQRDLEFQSKVSYLLLFSMITLFLLKCKFVHTQFKRGFLFCFSSPVV